MQAIVCRDFGLNVQLEDLPDPRPAPGQVLIAVRAVGVNFVDGLIVGGKYQIKPTLPYIPGFEVAGVISAVGDQVRNFEVGQDVFGTTGLKGGGYASAAVIASSQVYPLPSTLTHGQGATFLQSYCTAYFALTQRMMLGPEHTLLVLGASGGVGRAAVDVGKALGARVIAAASSDERLDACRNLEPDGYINYSVEDLKERARALSDGGVSAVFDPLGGTYSGPALRALHDDGTFLVVGFAAGSIPQLPANQILLRNRRVVGVDWGGWRTRNPNAQAELMAKLAPLLEGRQLKPREPQSYRLDQAARALADVLNRRVVGKAALEP